MFLLLAEAAAAVGVADITPVVSAITSLGFAIWFAYYTTTTTLPNLQKEHRDQSRETNERFTQVIRDQAEYHANTIKEVVAELKAEREAYDRWRMGQH